MFMFWKMVLGKRFCYFDYIEIFVIGFNFYMCMVIGKFIVLLIYILFFDIEIINGYI